MTVVFSIEEPIVIVKKIPTYLHIESNRVSFEFSCGYIYLTAGFCQLTPSYV